MFIASISATLATPIPTQAASWISTASASRRCGGSELAVVQAIGNGGRVEDDGGGYHRAGPGAAADLVDPADRVRAIRLEAEVGAGRAVVWHSRQRPADWRPRADFEPPTYRLGGGCSIL